MTALLIQIILVTAMVITGFLLPAVLEGLLPELARRGRKLPPTVRKVVTTGLSRGISAAGGFVLAIVYARAASLSEFGIFFAAQAVTATVVVLARLGLDYSSTRIIAPLFEAGERLAVYRWTTLSLAPVGTLGIVLAIIVAMLRGPIAAAFSLPEMAAILPIMALGIISLSLGEVIAGVLRGVGISQFSGMQSGGASMLAATIVAVLHLVFGAVTIEQATWCFVGSSFAVTGFGFILAWRVVARLPTEPNPAYPPRADIIDYYKRSLHLMVGLGFAAVSQLLPALFIGRLLTAEELGLYRIAERMALAVGLVFIVVGDAFASKFALLFKEGRIDELTASVRVSVLIPILVAGPVIAIFLVAHESLLRLLGPEYLAAGTVSAIMMAGLLLRAFTGPGSLLLIMGGKERAVTLAYFLAMGLNMMCQPLLIIGLGLPGAALAWAAATFFQNALQAYFAHRLLGVTTIPCWPRRSGR